VIPWDEGINVPSTNITTTITMTIASPIAGPLWNPRLIKLYACATALFCQFCAQAHISRQHAKTRIFGLDMPQFLCRIRNAPAEVHLGVLLWAVKTHGDA